MDRFLSVCGPDHPLKHKETDKAKERKLCLKCNKNKPTGRARVCSGCQKDNQRAPKSFAKMHR